MAFTFGSLKGAGCVFINIASGGDLLKDSEPGTVWCFLLAVGL